MITAHSSAKQFVNHSTTFQKCTLWLHSLNLRLSIPHGNTGCRLSSLITLIFFFWLGNPPPSASSWSPIRTNSSLKHLKPFCNVADCICDHNRKQIAHRFRLKILFSVFSFVEYNFTHTVFNRRRDRWSSWFVSPVNSLVCLVVFTSLFLVRVKLLPLEQ